ncbi:GNAT family N-acetyltransferase [Sneathiella marina]|uniref:GNAT family N-acetyltransferase n=1 Tax=Sneathiella marina TaxID=2950108 RepID=A0ABY4W2I3_9PROT|nr:GNAT family N-acetyltransferase [Sneathiella marina]USG61407.1 GNAT family N-acetyltransferase [Sneathiella marina]
MIRLSTKNDLQFLAAVERSAAQVFVDHFDGDTSYTDRTLAEDILLESHRQGSLWVAADAGKPIAFLAATRIEEALHIQEISVAFDHQGQGIGERLVQALISDARRRGHTHISLTTDRSLPWSRNFYRKLGFRVVPIEDCSAGLAALLLQDKQVSPVAGNRVAMKLCL